MQMQMLRNFFLEIMQSIQLFSKANVTQLFFLGGRNVLLNFEH